MTPERKKIVRILVLVAVFDLLLSGCCFFLWTRYYRQPKLPNEQEQAQLSARLLNLSAAAEGYFSTLPAAPDSSEAEILRKATEHDPRLLNELDDYRLRIASTQKHALLLLCTKDGKQALLEDAGCTASLDRRVREAAPCEFTLRTEEICR